MSHSYLQSSQLKIAAAASILLSSAPYSLADATSPYTIYYGTAAGAAIYGGYRGNASKGTNGTDNEFYNPKKRTEKEYLNFLYGFRQLAPKEVVLDNLALSDVNLQDLISIADGVTSEEKKDENGQVYYEYEINGVATHSLITVTCSKNKLFAHFVNAPAPEWRKDEEMLRHIHESFKTIDY